MRKRTNPAYKTWDNFKHDCRESHLELRETGGTIEELGFHNTNTIIYQMMARLQIDKDKCTSTSTQHATKLASANKVNTTMESQMKNLLSQVQALKLANTYGHQTNHGNNFECELGHRHRRGPNRGTVRGRGRSSTPNTPNYCWTQGNCAHGGKNAHILPTDTRRMQPSRT